MYVYTYVHACFGCGVGVAFGLDRKQESKNPVYIAKSKIIAMSIYM